MSSPRALVALASVPLLCAGARAQWSSDPLANLAVCAQPGDQAVPRIAAVGDGRTWIGWFDDRGGSYAVYVQLFDRDGVPQLGELEAGLVARAFGAPFSVVSGGIACLVSTALIAARSPRLRRYRRPEAEPAREV